MKLHILDKILEYENSIDILNDMVDEINNVVKKSNLVFSHLVIDRVEVYNDFYDYFLDNIKNIEEIIVVTKTVREISKEIIISTIDYIERAIPEIEILSNEFYKTPSSDSWNKLMDLIEGFKWIMDTFVAIDTNSQLKDIVENYEEWNLYAKDIYSLKELLNEFEEILDNGDLVSTADILSYEIIPLFEEMKDRLEKLVLEEVDMDDISRK